ncbi:MAG TPA: nucleotide exchange factor GrpE [Caulobacteraceae bacterium]|jgi:molecular chaperone GrpE|nr:nucleotide exchange factor GrpE [Caulobacteraceae bacterium]
MTDDTAPAANEDRTEDRVDETDALRAELAGLKEQVLRYAADAENTKRRAEREANDARAFAIQKFARDLLGVADNLARAREHAPANAEDPLVKNLAVGLEMTEKDLLSAFDRNGLKRLDPPRGARFDPHQHQAVMERPADDLGPGAVLEVLQPGYDLMGRIVRPAMVVVSARGSKGEAPAEAPAANPYAQPETESDGAGGSVDRKA